MKGIPERLAVRESGKPEHDRLEAFLSATFEGIVESEAGRIIACNEQFAQMVGWTVQELEGKPIGDLTAPEDRSRVLANITPNHEVVIEHTMLRKDGTRIMVEAHGRPMGLNCRRFTAVRDITASRQAEEALARREQQFQTILSSAHDGFWMTDSQGRLLEVNASACAMAGYSREEMLAMSIQDLAAGQTEEEMAARIRHIREHGWAAFESRFRRKDGRIVEIEFSVNFLDQEGGRFFAFIRDITERNRTREALKESEARFRTLIEQAPTAISISRNGTALYVNQKFLETFGSRNAHEYVERPVIEHWAPESHPIIAESIRQCSLGLPVPPTFEGIAQRQDGSRFPIHVALTVVNLSDGPASLAFLTDITERKQAEEADARLAAIVESSDDAIISKALDGTIVSWNHGAEKLFGYRAQEAVGQKMLLIIPPDRSNEEPDILARIARGETVEHFETVRITKSGRPIQVSVTISPIRNADGHITGASKIARDITDRKQAEEALRRARDELARANAGLERKVTERTAQLAEANANLETFAHTAAHDLRAPLRSITSFAQLLAADYGDRLDEMGGSMLERMRESARQMEQLLNDLLEYSRVTQKELRPEKVQLEAAVSEALALLEADIRSKQAEVRVERPLPEVVAHPATLVMLISNLVSNGLKFVPQGAKPQVRIWAQPMPASQGALPNEQSGESGCVRLWVEDSGIGIAPEHLGKVFGTFQRLHGKNTYQGAGLGLAIVRKGAERMGGRTGVESEVGKGSRFWIELKACSEAGIGAG